MATPGTVIAERLQHLMDAHRLSQHEVADRAKVSPSIINKILSGKTTMLQPPGRKKLSQFFNVPRDYFEPSGELSWLCKPLTDPINGHLFDLMAHSRHLYAISHDLRSFPAPLGLRLVLAAQQLQTMQHDDDELALHLQYEKRFCPLRRQSRSHFPYLQRIITSPYPFECSWKLQRADWLDEIINQICNAENVGRTAIGLLETESTWREFVSDLKAGIPDLPAGWTSLNVAYNKAGDGEHVEVAICAYTHEFVYYSTEPSKVHDALKAINRASDRIRHPFPSVEETRLLEFADSRAQVIKIIDKDWREPLESMPRRG